MAHPAVLDPDVVIDRNIQEEERLEQPADADSYCHIRSGDNVTAYCGYRTSGPATCKQFEGEEICPSCQRPNCPTCIAMSGLNEQLIPPEEP